ncbi:hypothetical protein PQQ51_13350 [Paraburkholderia xenovorans]|uniref:hypothetical protein n=1 Tax=Paraburkholderia xenovorans TaxID=36873 RepID=UPI0038B812A8
MKLSLCAAALLGLIALSDLHAAEAPSVQHRTDAAQADVPRPPMPTTLPPEVIAKAVAGMGLDPDSEKGQIAGRWFEHSVADPDWRAMLYQNGGLDLKASGDTPTYSGGARLGPEDRLKVIRLITGFASTLTPSECEALFTSRKGDDKLLKQLSAKQLDDMMKTFDVFIQTTAHAHSEPESYSIDQLLEAGSDIEARTEAALKREHLDTDPPSDTDAPGKSHDQSCKQMLTTFRTLQDAPDPTRRIVTWDLLSSPWAGTVFTHVLRTPDAFVASHFDLNRLPADMQQHLPAPGSRPLGYTKIVIEGDWENSTAEEKRTPYEETYWNLSDTGLVNRFTLGHPEKPSFGYFSTEYGYKSIRGQRISGGEAYAAPKLLAPSTYRMLDDGGVIPQPNRVYLSPRLQPVAQGVHDAQCESLGKYPASQVFKDFTGDAVDVNCKSVNDNGVTYQNREAYLYDYGISVSLFEIDKDGLSVSRIRKVTITR